MPTPPARAEGRSPIGLHAVALATLLTFGCTTVRAPVSGIAPTVPVHGATAEPQVELWLESGRDVTPAESARATADAREALRQALQDRRLGDDDVLVVRAQAVSRTRSRRHEQHAAVAGIVVGVVVLVALAVVAGSRGNAPGLPMRHAGRAAGGFRPGAPPVRPVIRPAVSPPLADRGGAGGANVDLDVRVVGAASDDGPPATQELAEVVRPAGSVPAPPPVASRERLSAVTLPAPSPLPLGDRSFFDGDWLRLELLVVDARTGALRWAKTVDEEVDVRDARKVRRTIDAALAGEDGWVAP